MGPSPNILWGKQKKHPTFFGGPSFQTHLLLTPRDFRLAHVGFRARGASSGCVSARQARGATEEFGQGPGLKFEQRVGQDQKAVTPLPKEQNSIKKKRRNREWTKGPPSKKRKKESGKQNKERQKQRKKHTNTNTHCIRAEWTPYLVGWQRRGLSHLSTCAAKASSPFHLRSLHLLKASDGLDYS